MSKKKSIVFILSFFVLCSSVGVSYAQRRGDQGYGVMLGNPSGLSFKMWLNERLGLDAAAGVARSELDVHASVLMHNFGWVNQDWARDAFSGILAHGDLPVYFGVGPRLLFEDNEELGIRVPFGISYLPNSSNWETFFEIAPVIRLTPDFGTNADFAIGLRYYFKAIRSNSRK